MKLEIIARHGPEKLAFRGSRLVWLKRYATGLQTWRSADITRGAATQRILDQWNAFTGQRVR